MKIKLIDFVITMHITFFLWGQKDIEWLPPMDIPLSLSGTFGEPRSTHFHMGIDIKTRGKEGLEVRSIAPGNISRLRVSLNGYGKTVYIDHHNNTSSVYAHLKKFAPKIEAYIKSIQYKKETYTLQQFPKKNEINIAAGEVIGYSGNTGSSSGPHLHFEMRNTKNQRPLNPLLFNLKVSDNQRPQIQKLFLFYPKSNSTVTYSELVSLKKVNDSTYHTPTISTSGKIGLGLEMFDRQNFSYSKNGIYKAEVLVNGKKIVLFEFDQIDYSDSKKLFINVDYPEYKANKNKIQKLFFQNHKPLTFMKFINNDGLLNIELGKSYQVKVIIQDFSGNCSYIVMYIEGSKKEIPSTKLEGKLIETHLDYTLRINDKEVFFPKNTFFKNAVLQVDEMQNTLSIGPNLFPFKNPYEIRFKVNEEDSLKLRQTFIAKKTEKKLSFLPTTREKGFWKTRVRDMGEYTLTRDSIAPKISPSNFKPNQWLSKIRFMKVKISDDSSGIQSYRGTINGEWILFEYEPKRKLLTYDFSDKVFDLARHELKLEVIDKAGNKSIYKTTFFRKYNLN